MLVRNNLNSFLKWAWLFALVACGGRAGSSDLPPPAPLGGTTSVATSAPSFGGSTSAVTSLASSGAWMLPMGGTDSANEVWSGGFHCWVVPGSTATTLISQNLCGNGRLESSNGEACDDGNRTAGDGCSPTCQIDPNWNCPTGCGPCVNTIVCGNSRIDETETCDDGNKKSGDGCSSACLKEPGAYICEPGQACKLNPLCGNGFVEDGEECDPGLGSSLDIDSGTPAYCTTLCTLPGACGDGKLQPGEECDQGTDNEDGLCNGCSTACKLDPYCGDGIVQPGCGEVCDDGVNAGAYGTCNPDCALAPYCGDGIVQTLYNEQCDLGNLNGITNCTFHCRLVILS